MKRKGVRLWAFILIGGLMVAGCAGMEFAPKNTIWYYHKELPAAEKAVEAARVAGKDKECPAEFNAAEKMKNDAYQTYWACRTKEAIAMANEAAGKANALCPKKVEAPKPAPVVVAPPPPPPPPPPLPPPPPPQAPTAKISAASKYVYAGKCTTLSWSVQGADSGMIDQGIGGVGPSGSKEICPKATAKYTITATNPGGSGTANVEIAVYQQTTLYVNFDSDKAEIRKADLPELQKAIDFVKKYPDTKISVVGYTDDTGPEAYNLKLSQKRAEAVRKYLVDSGVVKADMIRAEGRGEADPVADNKTKEGRFKNRRVEISEEGK